VLKKPRIHSPRLAQFSDLRGEVGSDSDDMDDDTPQSDDDDDGEEGLGFTAAMTSNQSGGPASEPDMGLEEELPPLFQGGDPSSSSSSSSSSSAKYRWFYLHRLVVKGLAV
jgi:hypothetical protein